MLGKKYQTGREEEGSIHLLIGSGVGEGIALSWEPSKEHRVRVACAQTTIMGL